jgi:tellurite resistance protein
MADRTMFTDDEWKALTEVPLRITLALVTVGPHGPISVVKEAAASAREVARPSEQGPADQLIAEIGKEAGTREARHDVEGHRGQSAEQVVNAALTDLGAAAAALQKLGPDEAAEVRAWFLDVAKAVAAAAKSISPEEQAVLDRIADTFSTPSG